MLSSWDTEGPRLKQLVESADSITELAEVVLEASGASSRTEKVDIAQTLRWAALSFATCVHRVERQYWFLIIARYVADRTLEEIANVLNVTRQRVSQILLRESERVFVSLSDDSPTGAAWSNSVPAGWSPWLLPSWIHNIASIQSSQQRESAANIFENLIYATNSELPKGEESPWRPFAVSGLVPSNDLLEKRRKPHDGYLLPEWISSLKKRIPRSDEVLYWHTSARGPVPARGTGSLELERPENLAMLTWADLVHCDHAGPKSAVIMLRNEVDTAQLKMRLCAAMTTGRYIPIPILVVLPSAEKTAELNWSSLDMEGVNIDTATISRMSSNSRETRGVGQVGLKPSVLQEVWHLHEGNLAEVMGLVDSNLSQNAAIKSLLWGRYRPLTNSGAIDFGLI